MIAYLIDQHVAGNYTIEKLVTFYNMKDHANAVEDTKEGRAINAVSRWT
jgi:Zn-dependent alcohol dehydrogenase